jgi:hypothetical protein
MGVTVEGAGWELVDKLRVALEKNIQLKYTRSSVEYSIVKAF